jgi:DNA repair protein RecO (recombination protein O)
MLQKQKIVAYILKIDAYRENSFLIKVFSPTEGQLHGIVYKKKIERNGSHLFPFRYLEILWSPTQKESLCYFHTIEESSNHIIHIKQLFIAYYFNELILKLIPPFQPMPKVFAAYKDALHDLAGINNDKATYSNDHQYLSNIMSRFELTLLYYLGYGLYFFECTDTGATIQAGQNYYFIPDQGLMNHPSSKINSIPISGNLLIRLQSTLVCENQAEHKELRWILDHVFKYLLASREKLHSRDQIDLWGELKEPLFL